MKKALALALAIACFTIPTRIAAQTNSNYQETINEYVNEICAITH
ncbi:starvation-inducible outer membrane lipoprotein [Caldicoprobacter guelmensis]|nr:hypothetical protein [Caldicoprobacter guelmensis]MBM7582608.1 starvation-inducible outer membrane lipoprotein [Caldicoprobacter guelmensis]